MRPVFGTQAYAKEQMRLRRALARCMRRLKRKAYKTNASMEAQMSDHITSINVTIYALDYGSNELGEAFGEFLRERLQAEYPGTKVNIDVRRNCSGVCPVPTVEREDALPTWHDETHLSLVITDIWECFLETEAHKYEVE